MEGYPPLPKKKKKGQTKIFIRHNLITIDECTI